jgi:hypothetical protein
MFSWPNLEAAKDMLIEIAHGNNSPYDQNKSTESWSVKILMVYGAQVIQ